MQLPSRGEIWHKIEKVSWGALAVVMLVVSILSGIVVALQYDYATPWYSTTAIELLAPYGHLFRSLHFYSSQFFLFFSIVHLLAVYGKSAKYSWIEWIRLTSSLPVILLLLFTGYILRGDATGNSAGRIAENLLLTIPFVGEGINTVLFSLSESGLRKVYLHHVISFDFLLLLLLWRHLHHYRVQFSRYPVQIVVLCAFCMGIAAPLEPEQAAVHYISGPWFFLGLQELLRYLPPLIAGIITPLLFVGALFLFYPGKEKKKLIMFFLVGWLAAYAVLSTAAFWRGIPN